MSGKEQKELLKACALKQEIEVYNMHTYKWYVEPDPAPFFANAKYRVKLKEVPDYINWDHVDSRFNYMARDSNGIAYCFRERPMRDPNYDHWVWEKLSDLSHTYACYFASYKRGTCAPENSLVCRPDIGQDQVYALDAETSCYPDKNPSFKGVVYGYGMP